MKKINLTFLIVISIFILAACDDSKSTEERIPSLEPVAAAIKTMVPLAYVASVSFSAVNGSVPDNASISNPCLSFPCLTTVMVTIDANSFATPLEGYGDILVAGLWTSATQAVVTVSFVDMDASSQSFPISKISTIPIAMNGSQLTIAYASIDIDIDIEPSDTISLSDEEVQNELDRLNQSVSNDAEVNVEMDAWVVNVDTKGTNNDYSDDTYSLSGGGQYVESTTNSAYAYQLGMVDVMMTPDCAINPVSGLAVMNEILVESGDATTWPKIGNAILQFESPCEGNAKVLLGVGTYGFVSGKYVSLAF